jgi:hypothetical protein
MGCAAEQLRRRYDGAAAKPALDNQLVTARRIVIITAPAASSVTRALSPPTRRILPVTNEDRLDDVRDLARTPDRLEVLELRMIHRRLDDAQRNRVDPDTALCIFDDKQFRRAIEATFDQRGEHRWYTFDGVVDQARRHLYDVPPTLPFHLSDGRLRDTKEARDVDARDCCKVGLRAKGLATKIPALLTSASMRQNRSKPYEIPRSAVFRSAMSPGATRAPSLIDWLDGPRRRDHPVVAIAVRFDERCADALRGAGDDGRFSLRCSRQSPSLIEAASQRERFPAPRCSFLRHRLKMQVARLILLRSGIPVAMETSQIPAYHS